MLLKKFGNLGAALKSAYPQFNWDEDKFSHTGKKSTQRWLQVNIAELLPEGSDILEAYTHPEVEETK
jgi:hypothetical protein